MNTLEDELENLVTEYLENDDFNSAGYTFGLSLKDKCPNLTMEQFQEFINGLKEAKVFPED